MCVQKLGGFRLVALSPLYMKWVFLDKPHLTILAEVSLVQFLSRV